MTPYARAELETARVRKKHVGTLERARQFLVESMMAMNGIVGQEAGGFSCSTSYSRNGREARVNRWYNLPEKLGAVVERLRSVRVDHKDARVLLTEFADRPGTLVYMDPPYLADRTNGYREEANDETFHRELLTLASKAKCMIFISGYDHPLYKEMLTSKRGWKRRAFRTTTRDSSGHDHKRTEVIWMNRVFVQAQKTNRLPLKLSKKEKQVGKVNPAR
jgi:DNA adenine methylase